MEGVENERGQTWIFLCYSFLCCFNLLAMGIVLFFYYCVTTNHKLPGLKQHTLLISQFLRVRSLGTAPLVSAQDVTRLQSTC